jgi:plastocyanin
VPRLRLPLLLSAAVVVLLAVFSYAATPPSGTQRQIVLEARSYAFTPERVEVTAGDTVTLRLEAQDVTHGLYVDGYGASTVAVPGRPAEVTFVADHPGKFRLRCSVACGALHPFMLGEFVVRPQRLYPLAQGLTVLAVVLLGLVLPGVLARAPSTRKPIELDRWPLLRRLLRSRFFPWALHVATLAGLLAVIVSGFLGTAVGSRNLAIVAVWIVWWGLLVLALLPVGGRAWCMICPLPVPGEWLARRGLLQVQPGRPRSLNWRWPRFLRNIWLQNFIFLGVATFSALVLTRPLLTSIALAAFLVLATVTGLLFSRRTFCRYLCPVGGFIGLYSNLAPLQLRVRDEDICRAHREKECLRGSAQGHGCPWGVYPGTLERNGPCGLCTECIKTCPRENVTLRVGQPGDGLLAEARLDEAFKALIMLAAALLYAVVLLGPWGWLKDLAGQPFQPSFLLYAGALWGGSLVLVPGLFFLCAAAGRALGRLRAVPLRQYFARSAYALVPLGLGAWAAFTLAFVPANLSYALNVLADPLGQGWNLFGLRDTPWTPLLGPAVPSLQVGVLLLGLLVSLVVAAAAAQRVGAAPRLAVWAALPVALFGLVYVGAFLRLYLG